MTAYYNEIDPFAAQWLRNLIVDGQIAPGDVDERSITEVRAPDLVGYDQCHFFAGIGGWSYALRLAGWPDYRPVWTGSCPCQPFSAAGKGEGERDKRHLWPEFFRLIRECRPDTVFGEQVAAAVGMRWLDVVSSDLEAEGYAVGACVLGAHSVGAPHIRQRLWFVAEPESQHDGSGSAGARWRAESPDSSATGGMADALSAGRAARRAGSGNRSVAGRCDNGGMGRAGEVAAGPSGLAGGLEHATSEQMGVSGRAREPRNTFWADAIWLPCLDGKARPVEPGIFPLAHGVPNRVGTLRGAGNAIGPQTAAAFIGAYMDIAA